MTKAIGLLSGGLDSTLAVKLILNQGIEVTALNFITPFCTCTRKGCKHEANRIAEKFDIPIKVVAAGDAYIKMVKNPKYGYGKNMNPCIDCRIFMLKKAKEYKEEMGASFLFTGEVLGQRPMSQRREAMTIIEKEAGLEGLILRPLSAQFLEPTIPEKEGLIDREKLFRISGRCRKPQMELAEEFGIEDYLCPAGGCRLTDPQFARRVGEAFEHDEDGIQDMNLLKYGRHFRLPNGIKVIVGRNEEENSIISRFAEEKDLLMEVVGFGSPITLLKDSRSEEDVKMAASVCVRYSNYKGKAEVRIGCRERWERTLFVEPIKEEFKKCLIGGISI
ncbi:tRNA sulfurtransferase [subsurface metagenome]